MDIELFLVGTDEDEAMGNEPFISFDDAANWIAKELPEGNIYNVTAFIDFTSLRLEK